MAFHDVQFPSDISYGSQGGPGFMTNIIALDSGAEERVARWNQARRQWNAAYGVKKKTQLTALQSFFIARRGAENSFRYKDWLDFASAQDHIGAVSYRDQSLGQGDGSTIQFQLQKRYFSGATIRTRTITKPVAGTVRIGVGGAEQIGNWSVNPLTGLVTFNLSVPSGIEVEAGFQFDNEARFGEGADQLLAFSIQDFDQGNAVPDVPIVEVINTSTLNDDVFYGGGATYDPMSADVSLSALDARVLSFNPDAAGRKVYLPPKAPLPGGGPYFYLKNLSGTVSISVRDIDTGSAVSLPPSALVEVVLADLGGSKVWYFLT